MSGLAAFGLFGFIFSIIAMSRVKRLERILRENGIRSTQAKFLGGQLRARVGQTVILSLEDADGDTVGKVCRILDADEEWALVLANEGKKTQCEKLIRLDSVKSVKQA